MTQFDKLLGDPGKSTHPIASKTAGHVGKWGTTSFTSLRGINGSHGNTNYNMVMMGFCHSNHMCIIAILQIFSYNTYIIIHI